MATQACVSRYFVEGATPMAFLLRGYKARLAYGGLVTMVVAAVRPNSSHLALALTLALTLPLTLILPLPLTLTLTLPLALPLTRWRGRCATP